LCLFKVLFMKRDDYAIKKWLVERKNQSLYRTLKTLESPQQTHIILDGKPLLSFSSNDYLGLAAHPKVISAFQKAANQYGVGSGGSHLVTGHCIEHIRLEEALAAFTGRDKARLFSSGYMANMGVINALVEAGDVVYQDRLNHASLLDAGILCKAKMIRYHHNNVAMLSKKLECQPSQSKQTSMIVSDGVFSMDGDIAFVTDLARLAKQYAAWLMIDDAHGFGVLGKTGGGLLDAENLNQDDVPILMATLGKALGTAGAFIAGSYDLIDYITQTARTFIYTTAMPPAIAAATIESLAIITQETWRREKLQVLIALFKAGAKERELPLLPSDTAIQPLMIGDSRTVLAIEKQLKDKGVLVIAIRPPTVPENTARLRITLSAEHSENDIYYLLDMLSLCQKRVVEKRADFHLPKVARESY
jgi:8-amino-7-oxononanoate synthase